MKKDVRIRERTRLSVVNLYPYACTSRSAWDVRFPKEKGKMADGKGRKKGICDFEHHLNSSSGRSQLALFGSQDRRVAAVDKAV